MKSHQGEAMKRIVFLAFVVGLTIVLIDPEFVFGGRGRGGFGGFGGGRGGGIGGGFGGGREFGGGAIGSYGGGAGIGARSASPIVGPSSIWDGGRAGGSMWDAGRTSGSYTTNRGTTID